MITAGDFRNGVTFEMDGQVMQVVEFPRQGRGVCPYEDEECHHRCRDRNFL